MSVSMIILFFLLLYLEVVIFAVLHVNEWMFNDTPAQK